MRVVGNFQCQGCDRVCDWSSREPVEVTDATEVKTIGGRFCNAPACVEAETRIYGVRCPWRDPAGTDQCPSCGSLYVSPSLLRGAAAGTFICIECGCQWSLGFAAALAAFGHAFARGLVYDALTKSRAFDPPVTPVYLIDATLDELARADPGSFVVNRIFDSCSPAMVEIHVEPPPGIALIGWKVEGRNILGVYVAWPWPDPPRCPHGRIGPEHCATCTGNEDHHP